MLNPQWNRYPYEKDLNLWEEMQTKLQGYYRFRRDEFFEDYKPEIDRLYNSYVITEKGFRVNPRRATREKFQILSKGIMEHLEYVTQDYRKELEQKWRENEEDLGARLEREHELERRKYEIDTDSSIKNTRIKISSRIDYPHADLPAVIWDKKDSEYVLKPQVEEFIKNISEKVLSSKFNNYQEWFSTVLLGSSIATQFWTATSDIDLKLIIDPQKFIESNPDFKNLDTEELRDQLADILEEFKYVYKVNKHDIEFYPRFISEINTKDFIKRFDSLYDIYNRTWIKPPKLVDTESYDRDREIEDGEKLALDWAEKWDLSLGEIKRKAKEFDLVNKYIQSLDGISKAKLNLKIEDLLEELKEQIDQLYSEKKTVKEEYYNAYEEWGENLEKYYDTVNAMPEVIQIKLLNLWGYIKIIRELTEISKDKEKLETKDIDKIERILNRESGKDFIMKKISSRDVFSANVEYNRNFQYEDYPIDSTFDPEELAMGIKVEMEHANPGLGQKENLAIAKEIAKDHLMENSHYYSNLKKIHKD